MNETIQKKDEWDWTIISWFVIAHLIAFIGPFYYTSVGAIIVGFVLYVVTAIGITLGFHRLLTHRSFKSPRWVRRVLATIGTLALQRGPVEWVGHHRMHHAGSDTDKDPHDASRGFWFSHIGWMCMKRQGFELATARKFARDVAADPYMEWLTKHSVHVALQVAFGVLLLLAGGMDYVIWGIFVRVVVTYHVTWLVNSAAHMFGYRNYETTDLATNCWWVGLLAMGEGWHNNHHAFGECARAGHKWWEFDLTWQVIRLMKLLGLATDIKATPRYDEGEEQTEAGGGLIEPIQPAYLAKVATKK